ncbi:MAG: FAD-dependent oxidoreductase [Candidatus Baltobacteraceae bacterium]
MQERIVIVGGVAAGASAAAKARRTSETAEIVMFESGAYMSFANCGLPYYVGGEIAERDDLFVASPAEFMTRFRVDVRLNSKVVQVHAGEREVSYLDSDGGPQRLAYDRLVLATGTVPIVPPIPGLDGPTIFQCRTVPDADAIVARIEAVDARTPSPSTGGGGLALVIGGGYIGLECAEQLLQRGFGVTLVEAQEQLMGPLDAEMAQPLQSALEASGVTVIVSDAVARIEPNGARSKAILRSGREIVFDVALVGTGVRPNVELAQRAGLRLGVSGAIAVDAQQRTSDDAIFAAGDNSETIFTPTGEAVNLPLAGPANKAGRVAGQNAAFDLAGLAQDDARRLRMGGTLGTAIVRCCDTVAGVTGLSEKEARRRGIPVRTAYAPGPSHAGYYPGATQMLLKLLYSPENGRLLGAQAVGQHGVDKRLDVLATALYAGLSVEDLERLDLCYAPPFGSAKDVAVVAGFVAANAWRGSSPGITPTALRHELSTGASPFLLDVRTQREVEAGRLQSALNIPVDELRERTSEVPRDRPIVVYCAGGYRSYIAQQILLGSGFAGVRNLYGGYRLAHRVLGPELTEEPAPGGA